MPSSKLFCIVLCLLCATLPARAEKPNDNRSNDSSQRMENAYTKEWGGKDIYQWKKDLIHPDPTYRVAAVLALLNFKQAAEAVPEVIKRLYEDGDASVRIKAAKFMQWVRPKDADRTRVIRGLAHALRDPQAVVRYEAACSLQSQSFCPFNYDNKEERDAVQDLVACLRSTGTTSSYEVREMCIEALIKARVDPKTGPDQRVTEALIYHADFRNEAATRVRVKAIVALGAQGRPQDPRLYQRVMDILKSTANFHSKNPSVRIWSHVAVIALEEKANKKDLETIVGYLKVREAAVRAEAVMALGALENKAQDHVAKILDMLKEEKIPAVKANAALALGRMQNTGPNVINSLIRLTEEKERENILTVLSACTAFVMLGANNAEVMKAMDKVLEHESLEKWQKDSVRQMIEELQNPKKKPLRNAVRNPEQGIAPANGANKQKVNRR